MKKVLIIILTFLSCYSYSQTAVGLKFDLDGMPIYNYFDPLAYSPSNKLIINKNTNSFMTGHVYDKNGNRNEGLVKLVYKHEYNDFAKIYFKKNMNDTKKVFKSDNVLGFVVGVDSFMVISNYKLRRKVKEDNVFAQYVTEFNDYTFVKHVKLNLSTPSSVSHVQASYLSEPSVVETYLVKHRDSVVWENIPSNKNFKEAAIKYFGHVGYLKDKIENGKYKHEDILTLLKTCEYHYNFQNGKVMYFDSYWQETLVKKHAKFSGKIEKVKDSIFTINYFNKTNKLYTVEYSSFYPNTKHGTFIIYNENGNKRQIIHFNRNNPRQITLLDSKENIKMKYMFIGQTNPTNGEFEFNIKYLNYNDSEGEENFQGTKVIEKKLLDSNKRQYNLKFKNRELISSSYLDEGKEIYQIVNKKDSPKVKQLQNKLDSYLKKNKFDTTITHHIQGVLMIQLIVNKQGNVIKGQLLNSLDSEADKFINGYISDKLLYSSNNTFSLKPLKLDKQKRDYELIVPLVFSYDRKNRKMLYHNSMYWDFNQMMINNAIEQARPNY